MRIAVVDVAAQGGGALSVLYDFVDRIIECEGKSKNEWYLITSVVETKESEHVHNLRFSEVKHSWFRRLWWEYTAFKRLVKELRKDDKNLVVGTNFYNYIMPLVRYSTGDCAELSDKQDGGFRIISNIIGREGEYVTLRNGTHISAEALDTCIFTYIPRLGGTQIVQNSLDKLDVKIIPLEGFSDVDKNILKAKMVEIFGADMEINISKVNELEKSKNGKHWLVISNL